MLSDHHIHTAFSGDSSELPDAQAAAAHELGMKEICITDHHDFGSETMCSTNFILDLPAYYKAMKELQARWDGKLKINIGIELGLMARHRDVLEQTVAGWDFDYVIGSSHFIDGYDVYDRRFYEGRPESEPYRRFFESTLNRVKLFDCFDCLGHLDYVIRYGPNKNANYRPADYLDVVDEILNVLITKGKGLECNTAGFKYGLGHPHPYEELIKRYRELGGEIITVGSDSHKREQTGG